MDAKTRFGLGAELRFEPREAGDASKGVPRLFVIPLVLTVFVCRRPAGLVAGFPRRSGRTYAGVCAAGWTVGSDAGWSVACRMR